MGLPPAPGAAAIAASFAPGLGEGTSARLPPYRHRAMRTITAHAGAGAGVGSLEQGPGGNGELFPKSSAAPAPTPTVAATGGVSRGRLFLYFFLWYAFNIAFNYLFKTSLEVYNFPWLLSVVQLGARRGGGGRG